MSLVSNPSKTINSIKSRSVAAYSQIPYVFQRKDFDAGDDYATVNNNGGFVEFAGWQDSILPFARGIRQGDQIFVAGTYQKFGTVTNNITSPTTVVTTDIPFIGSASTSHFNDFTARLNHRYEIQIFDKDDNNLLNGTDFLRYSAKPNGDLFIDLKPFIRSYIYKNRDFEFYINWRETWEGSSNSYTQDENIQAIEAQRGLLSVEGSNMWPFLQKFSSELQLDDPFVALGPSGYTDYNWSFVSGNWQVDSINQGGQSQYLKIITKAGSNQRVRVNVTVDFIKSAATSLNFQLLRRSGGGPPIGSAAQAVGVLQESGTQVVQFDTGTPIAFDDIGLSTFYLSSTTTMQIKITQIEIVQNDDVVKPGIFLTSLLEPKAWPGYKTLLSVLIDLDANSRLSGNTTVFQRIKNINKVNTGTLDTSENLPNSVPQVFDLDISRDDIPADGKFLNINVGDGTETKTLQEINFRLEPLCRNPIMIEWTNPQGGLSQWLFSINQDYIFERAQSVEWEQPIEQDWSEANRTFNVLTQAYGSTIKVFADNLTKNEYISLTAMLLSNNINIWLDVEGERKVSVIPITNSVPFSTRPEGQSYSLEAEFRFPDNFNIFEFDLINFPSGS